MATSIVRPVYLKKTVTSSSITSATAVDLTTVAAGEFYIRNIILKTDATGLTGGTNLTVQSNNAKGLAAVLTTAVSGLGANKTIDITTGSVTKAPTVLENGKKLQVICTAADCSGTGTVDIYIVMDKLDASCNIDVV